MTAVPFTVIAREGKVLESVSGSDASRVRTAVEKFAGTGNSPAAAGNGAATLPPALKAEPQVQKKAPQETTNGATTAAANGAVTKDLSGYKPVEGEAQTAPAYSSGKEDKDDLNERLGKLVKAA